MLVLSREEGQAVEINNDTTVTVLSIRGGRVRLGFEAPRGVQIIRGEVKERWDEIDRQREGSSGEEPAESGQS